MTESNFNQYPYFDDFVPGNNHLRVLFKPGRDIQVRELNNIQSIQQNQVAKFSANMFRNGARVSGGRFNTYSATYITLASIPDSVRVENIITAISGVSAKIIHIDTTLNGNIALFFIYNSTGTDEETREFYSGNSISISSGNDILFSGNILSISTGKLFTVDEGVFYYNGRFIQNSAQTITLSFATPIPESKIGFDVVEQIIDHFDEPSLLDNASGYPSFDSPGADRHKVQLVLTRRSNSPNDGDRFIILAKVNSNGEFSYLKTDTEYSDWGDMLAKRTYEESGNYELKPFKVKIINHKAEFINDPNGLSIDGSPDNYVAVVDPYTAYVQGYRVQSLTKTNVIAPKGRSTKAINNIQKVLGNCSSFIATPVGNSRTIPNSLDIGSTDFINTIDMYNGPIVSGNVSGSIIGTIEVIDSIPMGSAYRFIVSKVSMISGQSISNVQSMKCGSDFILSCPTPLILSNYDISPSIINISDGLPIKTMAETDLITGDIQAIKRVTFHLTIESDGYVDIVAPSGDLFISEHEVCVNIKNGLTYSRINSPTVTFNSAMDTATIDCDIINAGMDVTVIINMKDSNVLVKSKEVQTITDTFSGIASQSEFTLSKSDIIKILSVKLVNITLPSDIIAIPISRFKLYNGQASTHYEEGKVALKNNEVLAYGVNLNNYDLKIEYEYYSHVGNDGVFTRDSYDEPDISKIPSYIGPSNNVINLASAIDFRPLVMGGNIISSSMILNSKFPVTYDVEVYQPRIDLLAIDKFGQLYIKTGKPSLDPRAPAPNDKDMGIFEIFVSPYTTALSGIVPIRIENKRYTMRDIGKIETRIKNMEYYTALTLLEKTAESMSIKDSNGLDRFKNGFIADDFSKYQAGDIGSSEFQAGLDRSKRELRPGFVARNRKVSFNVDESLNVVNKNGMILIDYDEEEYEKQPFATKNLSINPYFIYKKIGNMTLTPNNDTWTDTDQAPDISFTIDSGVEAFQNVADRSGVLQTEWGSWFETNRTILTTIDADDTSSIRASTPITSEDQAENQANRLRNPWPSGTTTQTVTISTTVIESKEGLAKSVGERTDSYSWSNISDVKLTTFMRPIRIQWRVTGLAPETRHYAFFDGKDMNSQTRMLSNNYGDSLFSNAQGEMEGEIRIDEDQFYVGSRNFTLATTKDYEQLLTDSNYSTATSTFFSGGLDVTVQDVNMNVITPTWNEQIVRDTRTSITNNIEVSLTSNELQRRREVNESITRAEMERIRASTQSERADMERRIIERAEMGFKNIVDLLARGGFFDPIAQSFTPTKNMFITSIDLFFSNVDKQEQNFWVSIRKTDNGYPTFTDIAIKHVNISQVNVSDDSLTKTNIAFDWPVFVEQGVEYCFVIGGWSPGTRVWIAKVGDPLVNDPTKIVETQPVTGSSFRSQNGTTWNAEQFEDIKYTLYVAKFKYSTAKIVLNNTNELELLPEDPFECEIGLENIRVYSKNHGLHSGDKFTINMFENEEFILKTDNGRSPTPGQNIYSSSGTATITEVVPDQLTGTVKIKITDMNGFIKTDDIFTCDTMDILASDGSISARLSQVKGTIIAGPIDNIAGIPIEQLAGTHEVFVADTQDTFVFKINSANVPTSSGRFGGKNSRISQNTKYEIFNVSGAYLLYGSAEAWTLKGVGHNPENGIFQSKDYQEITPKIFTPSYDIHLDIPYKLANDLNENNIKSKKSMTVTGIFSTPSYYVSPVLNLNTFSVITVSNKIDWIDESAMDIAPFAGVHYSPETETDGSEPYKYVTKKVTLKNPASDLMIAFDVYKDKDADFDIYYKILYTHESVNIDTDKTWTLVPNVVKRDSVDLQDRIEYELLLSDQYGTTWAPIEYQSFKIKIVGRAKNTAKPPLFQNFRAVAVT